MNDCTITALVPKGRRPKGGPRPPALRSAVTNGTKLFVDGAHEGPWARRFRDLVQLHEEDLGPRQTLSEGQRSLCRRVATIEVTLEQWEGKLSKGEDIDLGAYREMTGQLTRTLNALGIKRVVSTAANPVLDHFSRPPERSA